MKYQTDDVVSETDRRLMRRSQTWDPESYASGGRFVADLAQPVVELLEPVPGERILDLGCGDGALTVKLVELGCDVVGVDSSAELITAARARGLDARLIDARKLTFAEEFDAVFSNAALHWIDRPDAVLDGVWRALKPGARFVAEMGGRGNVESIISALSDSLRRRGIDSSTLNPWYFPDDIAYRGRLEARGFHVRYSALIPRPTRLPGDIVQWLEIFARSFTAALAEDERQLVSAEVQAQLEDQCCDENGDWTIGCVRLRFAAVKPLAY